MALKSIAVDGCELDFEESASGDIEITGELSEKDKCDGKKAYKVIKFSVTNYVGGSIVSQGHGEGQIVASSANARIEGNKATLEGDKSVTIVFQGLSAAPAPTTHNNKVYVKKAGQTKCKAL